MVKESWGIPRRREAEGQEDMDRRNPDEDQDSRCRSRQEIRDQRSVISDHRHQISISSNLSQAPRGESSAVKGDQCISHIHGGGHERIA